MKKIAIIVVISVTLCQFSLAQQQETKSTLSLPAQAHKESRSPRSVIKINLTPAMFKTLSLQAEHAVHRKVSLAFQYNRMFEHRLLSVRLPFDDRSDPMIEGFSLTPEIRVFPGKKLLRPAPHGFYFGGYFRYAKRTITWDRYTPSYTLNNKINYHAYTYGLFLGKQWLIGKHFTIDLLIAGIGYGTSRIEGGFYVPDLNLPPDVQEAMRSEYAQMFSGFLGRVFGFSGASFDTNTNSLNVVVKNVPAYSFRLMGLSFGYAF